MRFRADCPYRKENRTEYGQANNSAQTGKKFPILYQCAGRLSPMPFRPRYFVRRK